MHIRWQNAESLSIILGPDNTLLDPKKKWWIAYSLKKIKKEKITSKEVRNLCRLKKEIYVNTIKFIGNQHNHKTEQL